MGNTLECVDSKAQPDFNLSIDDSPSPTGYKNKLKFDSPKYQRNKKNDVNPERHERFVADLKAIRKLQAAYNINNKAREFSSMGSQGSSKTNYSTPYNEDTKEDEEIAANNTFRKSYELQFAESEPKLGDADYEKIIQSPGFVREKPSSSQSLLLNSNDANVKSIEHHDENEDSEYDRAAPLSLTKSKQWRDNHKLVSIMRQDSKKIIALKAPINQHSQCLIPSDINATDLITSKQYVQNGLTSPSISDDSDDHGYNNTITLDKDSNNESKPFNEDQFDSESIIHIIFQENNFNEFQILLSRLSQSQDLHLIRFHNGLTLLHLTVMSNDLKKTLYLIDEIGLDVGIADTNGQTAFDWALICNNREMVKHLLNRMAKNSSNNHTLFVTEDSKKTVSIPIIRSLRDSIDDITATTDIVNAADTNYHNAILRLDFVAGENDSNEEHSDEIVPSVIELGTINDDSSSTLTLDVASSHFNNDNNSLGHRGQSNKSFTKRLRKHVTKGMSKMWSSVRLKSHQHHEVSDS